MLTPNILKDFLYSPVWAELSASLRARKRSIQRDINDPAKEQSAMLNRGALMELDALLLLPGEILQALSEDEEERTADYDNRRE